MQLVKATADDIREVTVMAKHFEKETAHLKVDVETSVANYVKFIESGIGTVFALKEGGKVIGALGCLKFPDIHSGEAMAVETFWFVLPEYRGAGLRLFTEFERWAKSEGCSKCAMIHLSDSHPDTLERLYIRKGYKLVEKHYIRSLV